MNCQAVQRWWAIGAVILGGALAQPAVQVDEAEPQVLTWTPPAYPPELRQAKLEGEVLVTFVVDATGAVSSAKVKTSTDPRFEAAALAAVRAWTFDPALERGEKVARAMEVPVWFRLNDAKHVTGTIYLPPVEPRVLPRTGARVTRYASPDYPAALEARKMDGMVVLRFVVTPDGRAEQPTVRSTTHVALVRPALDALRKCEFAPATQGELPARAELEAPFEFTVSGTGRADVLTANGLAPAEGGTWAEFDVLPMLEVRVDPPYPRARLLADESGEAEVALTITNTGLVKDVAVMAASQPEFGAALEAAAACWQFRPTRNRDGVVEARLVLKHSFVPPTEDAADPDVAAVARLARALRPDGGGVGSARGLDGKLTPLWRVGPRYPAGLKMQSVSGEAEIEFVVDRDGRVRVPLVRRATHEAFGWAAATAVEQWLFAPPTRGGQPTEVRVAIPFSFRPDEA